MRYVNYSITIINTFFEYNRLRVRLLENAVIIVIDCDYKLRLLRVWWELGSRRWARICSPSISTAQFRYEDIKTAGLSLTWSPHQRRELSTCYIHNWVSNQREKTLIWEPVAWSHVFLNKMMNLPFADSGMNFFVPLFCVSRVLRGLLVHRSFIMRHDAVTKTPIGNNMKVIEEKL